MKRLIIFLVAAVALPTSVALAQGNPTQGGKSAPKVHEVSGKTRPLPVRIPKVFR